MDGGELSQAGWPGLLIMKSERILEAEGHKRTGLAGLKTARHRNLFVDTAEARIIVIVSGSFGTTLTGCYWKCFS